MATTHSMGAQVVLIRAKFIAETLGHHYMGTEHLLAAYIVTRKEDDSLHESLTLGSVIDQIIQIIGTGSITANIGLIESPINKTQRARLVVDMAEKLALNADRRVRGSDIMDAMLLEGTGVGFQILIKLTQTNMPELRELLLPKMSSS